MLSWTKGRPIAIIKKGKYNNRIIHIIEDENELEKMGEIPEEMKEFRISNDDVGIIQPLPKFNKSDRCFVAGPTECGKTRYCKKYIKQYQKVYPKKKIFIFSDLENDPMIDDVKNITRFELDDELLEKPPIEPEVFKNSICLFDDIDSIQDKRILKYVQGLRDSILKKGRHSNILCLVTSHILANRDDTKIILSQSNSITMFCRSGATHGIRYILKEYIGADRENIRKILNLPSSWVTIYKNYPQYVVYKKGVFIL